jgi:hypothetical protein
MQHMQSTTKVTFQRGMIEAKQVGHKKTTIRTSLKKLHESTS